MTTSLTRDHIRQHIRQARRMLSMPQQQHDALQLLRRLINSTKVQQATNIAVSLAFDGEISTSPFIEWAWKNNKQLYLPVVHPVNKGQLLFVHYTNSTEMVTNKYGISEPKLTPSTTCPIEQLDLILAPLVAFDKQGNRIGMGGGYYDRMLAPWFEFKTGPYPIGLAHDCQLVEQLPIQSWDVPLPEIITPSQHHHFMAKHLD